MDVNLVRRGILVAGVAAGIGACRNSSGATDGRKLRSVPDRSLSGTRIVNFNRDVSLSTVGRKIAICRKNQSNNQFSVLDLNNRDEIVFTLPDFYMVYGCSLNEDGNRVALIAQNTHYDNYLIEIDLSLCRAVKALHDKERLFYLPKYIGNDLYFLKSDEADWVTLETRFISLTTESDAKNEVYRLFKMVGGKEILASDKPIYTPTSMHRVERGIIINKSCDEFANKHINLRGPAIETTDVEGMGEIFEIPAMVPVRVIGGSQKTYIYDNGIYEISLPFEQFVNSLSRVSISKYIEIFGDRGRIVEDLDVNFIHNNVFYKYEYVNFITSSKDGYLLSGIPLSVEKSEAKMEFIICGADFQIKSVHQFVSGGLNSREIHLRLGE